MELHTYDLGVPLDGLVRDARRATEGWDWSRGAYGHALSLAAYQQLHPWGRYRYENFPCAALLGECPLFRQIFDGLECEKVSFRLLRRGPGSAYTWHTDRRKGRGVARFQVPIVSDDAAFLVTTDYESPDQVRGPRSGRVSEESFHGLALANAGHFRKHHLELGRLHYFDTTRAHTLVNPGPGERITLAFDLVVNHWVIERFPEVRDEIAGGESAEPLPRPAPLRRGLAFAGSRFYPLRNQARRHLRDRATRWGEAAST